VIGLVIGLSALVCLAGLGMPLWIRTLSHASAKATRSVASMPTSVATDPSSAGAPASSPMPSAVSPYRHAVPILMYHVIGTPPVGNPNPDLFVRPQEFQAQVRYLADNGYHVVNLQQVWDAWQGHATLPPKPVVLTFDDGYLPDYTVAAPILQAYHWSGVLFLIAGRRPPALYPSVVRALIHDGWEIDSHTMTHVEVTGLSASQLTFQIGVSRTTLHRMFGVPANFFCYPSGRYDARAIAAVRAAGYLAATTTAHGLAQPSDGRYTLTRIRVSRGESVAGFAAELK
jgi:peptidoglycan/xylan/chitin deacetylase (PgdA/CDA1 family)